MINKVEFQNMKFLSHGIIEENPKKELNRVPHSWRPINSNDLELRENIRDIMWAKAEEYRTENDDNGISDYNIIEKCCRIPNDTMKKALNGRYKLTRNFLAKFTVGLKLDIEEANELFRKHSGELNLTNDFDYIVYHALKSKDNIDFFLDEVYEYLGINLDVDRL